MSNDVLENIAKRASTSTAAFKHSFTPRISIRKPGVIRSGKLVGTKRLSKSSISELMELKRNLSESANNLIILDNDLKDCFNRLTIQQKKQIVPILQSTINIFEYLLASHQTLFHVFKLNFDFEPLEHAMSLIQENINDLNLSVYFSENPIED
jgi:hypothetical protein